MFGRGAMLQPFEEAAFAMQPGDLRGPVHTEVGYHILECTEHVAAYVQPLSLVYSIVASDLAKQQADTLARQRADALLRPLADRHEARAMAARESLEVHSFVVGDDDPMYNENLKDYFAELKTMRAGQVMRRSQIFKGGGYWITWVDSISTGGVPQWDEVRDKAIQAYREGAGERALQAKVAELDSLERQGTPLDSLAVLWGGLTRSKEYGPVGTSDRADIPAALDSLVFGKDERPAPLAVGATSGWVRWNDGMARVRLVERREPPRDRVMARVEELRRAAVDRRMAAWFDELKARYPVRILDRVIGAIPLPEPPPEE